jgi:mRNA interferase RelE/StbE
VSYALRILPHAEKQLSQLISPIYDSTKARIFELRDAPRPPGCRKLRGREGWRIRVGDYRLIYKINDIEKTVAVLQIGHRSDVYR